MARANTNTKGKPRTQNRLWLARKRRGLWQRQVTHLLNHKTTDQISRYEKGQRLPNLRTALMLEIIYGVPPRVLFKDLFEQLREKIVERIKSHQGLKGLYGELPTEGQEPHQFCAYAELLRLPNLSEEEMRTVRDHITFLAQRFAHVQGAL